MILELIEPINLRATLLSGQAFRWKYKSGWFDGVIGDTGIRLREISDMKIEFYCEPDKEEHFTKQLLDYLGYQYNINEIYLSLSKDKSVANAIKQYHGMRILKQDPWECMISFICSSASNIKRITNNIEAICDKFGNPISNDTNSRKTFPSAQILSNVTSEELRNLGLGYRADYVRSAALTVSKMKKQLFYYRKESYDDCLNFLTTINGIGDKIANCILLFSLDKPHAFPVDVWIDRVLRESYFETQTKMSKIDMRRWSQQYFGEYAGFANHYLFHSRRKNNI